MTDAGEIKTLLGVDIIRYRLNKKIYLSQEKYIRKILEKYNMSNCKPISTPMCSITKLTRSESKDTTQKLPYRELVGALMYLMIASRPDLAYTMSVLSRYLDCYNESHWKAIKRTLRYLSGTTNHFLTLGGNTADPNIICFADADYGGDIDTGKSTSGYVCLLNDGTVSWFSKKQPTVACSTTEAEYISLWESAKHISWLRTLISELGYNQSNPTIINEDNQGCIALTKFNPVLFASRVSKTGLSDFEFLHEKIKQAIAIYFKSLIILKIIFKL